jgi:poly(hydroxyalkanoate) depolymerase family esterase
MTGVRSTIDAIASSSRGFLAAALLVLVALAAAHATEPRQEVDFGSNPGNLRMFSYVPAGVGAGAPLVVVLHGCKQHAATFARDAGWLALADKAKVALLLPEQKGLPSFLYDIYVFPWVTAWYGANNQNACFNWFDPEKTRRDRGEALSIRQMIDTMIARYSLDPSRVYVVGLSAGGAMTAALLAAYPERFAGAAIVAGVPFGCADDVEKALECINPGVDLAPAEWRRRVDHAAGTGARFPPISIWQGDADTRVAPRNRQELVEEWTAADGLPPTPTRREDDQRTTRELYADNAGVTRVESVVVHGLGHAFPIGGHGCGKAGDFVASAGVCAAKEIAHFWGLSGDN